MRDSARQLLVALLLSSPLAAGAQDMPSVDAWMVHHQGDLGTNEVFLIDGRPEQILKRAGGVRALPVYRISQEEMLRNLKTYELEVDCARNRVRLKSAQNFSALSKLRTPVKVSSAWQTSPEPWLAQSRDFVCNPTERGAGTMEHWGLAPFMVLVEKSETYFHSLIREQSIQRALRTIDQAFDAMPQAASGDTRS